MDVVKVDIPKDVSDQALAYLTINCSFIPDLGLFHGRMGFVLFFVHYARVFHNSVYENFAVKLLEEIFEGLDNESSIGLESGLCGIGWGIEYLVQNGFMEGDTDEILKEVDARIMEYDPRRMLNKNFRRGLAGILAYVVARLSSPRKKSEKPFDEKYLCSLKESIEQSDAASFKEMPQGLRENFIQVLNGNTIAPLTLSYLFSSLSSTQKKIALSDETFFINGLEYYWSYLDDLGKLFPNINIPQEISLKKRNLYLVSNETRSSRYGIGTYIYHVIEALKNTNIHVTVILFESKKTTTVQIENKSEVQYIYIGEPLDINKNLHWQVRQKLYAENTWALLHSIIPQSVEPIFLMNHLHFTNLVKKIREYYINAKIIGIVHYMEWSFNLLGDRERLKEIISNNDIHYASLRKGLDENKYFFNLCDQVMAIARHSYNFLLEDCKIPVGKLVLIPHGIKDQMPAIKDKSLLRRKYGFNENEILIIFAGRVDPIKGVDLLAEAFFKLCQKYKHIRLLVAGDGAYDLIQEPLLTCNTQISMLGFVDKQSLYELFYISNIGVVPSLYEDFGYVAVEMMMNELPVIAGNRSGLEEIVENGETGWIVPFKRDIKYAKENAEALRLCIEKMIISPSETQIMGKKGRNRFLKYYDLACFKRRLIENLI